MTLIYRRCAGMDVHQKSITVCARIRVARDRFHTETAVFGTFTQDLREMAQWLGKRKIRHVAMESTGVYWKPVWNVFEASRLKFEMVLVNPQHIKALPGRKTDQQDAERIATYLQEGLLRGSFVPPPPVRDLRELTRRRTHLQGDRNRVINRIIRLLETANIKLSSVLSDVTGQSGRAIRSAIVSGQTAAGDLATHISSRVRHTREEFELALEGRYSDHLRWLLRQLLEELDYLDRRVDLVELRIGQKTQPHTELIARLCTLPGDCAHHPGRDRYRYERVSQRASSRQLGRAVSREFGKRRQALQRPHAQGRPLSAPRSGAERLGRYAHERLCAYRFLLSHCHPRGHEESRCRGCSSHTDAGLFHHPRRRRISGCGRRSLRSPQSRKNGAAAGTAAAAHRVRSHPDTETAGHTASTRTTVTGSDLHKMQKVGDRLHPYPAENTPDVKAISLIRHSLRSLEFRRNKSFAYHGAQLFVSAPRRPISRPLRPRPRRPFQRRLCPRLVPYHGRQSRSSRS